MKKYFFFFFLSVKSNSYQNKQTKQTNKKKPTLKRFPYSPCIHKYVMESICMQNSEIFQLDMSSAVVNFPEIFPQRSNKNGSNLWDDTITLFVTFHLPTLCVTCIHGTCKICMVVQQKPQVTSCFMSSISSLC